MRAIVAATCAAIALLSAPAPAGAARGEERILTGQINLNTASVEQLRMLPGVGPAKARAIMATRMKRPFRQPHEITRVRGIGPAFFKKHREHLRVDGETTLAVVRRPVAAR